MLSRFLTYLFPVRCAGCGCAGSALCTACIKTIPLAPPMRERHMSGIYEYGNAFVARSIRTLKYGRKTEMAHALSIAATDHVIALIDECMSSSTQPAIVFVPIPIYRTRIYERGFNQSILVARWISDRITGTNVQEMLRKTKPTLPQARMHGRNARLHNVGQSMESARCDKQTLYIVIDDVATTGTTFAEARRALRTAGARHVICVALAHGSTRTV